MILEEAGSFNPMDYLVVCSVSLLAAVLALFSGFGLGTLLMPVLAVFFPPEVAIAATAVVHLANNLFKFALFGKYADRKVVLSFALPAAAMAVIGAWILLAVSATPPLVVYRIWNRTCTITPVKVLVAALILFFAVIELLPHFQTLTFRPRYTSLGGALSGFFGGLSGHQGALRTAFLSRAGLGKEAFIGTMIVCAVVVDISRLIVYGTSFLAGDLAILGSGDGFGLILAAALAAFLGSWVATRLIRKVTIGAVHSLIGVLLVLVSLALGSGLL